MLEGVVGAVAWTGETRSRWAMAVSEHKIADGIRSEEKLQWISEWLFAALGGLGENPKTMGIGCDPSALTAKYIELSAGLLQHLAHAVNLGENRLSARIPFWHPDRCAAGASSP